MRREREREREREYKNTLLPSTLFSSSNQEDSLRFQHYDQIRALFENALDAVVGMDDKGVITEWNHQAEIIFGWPKEEAIGRRMSETIIPHQYRAAHEKGLKKFFETGTGPVLNTRLELTGLRKDGAEFPIELTVTPIKTNGTFVFYAFLRDITERKLRKRELEESLINEKSIVEKLKIEKELREKFVSTLTHDLRTPLTAVKMSAQLIEHHLDNTDAVRDLSAKIAENVNRVDKMIQDLLDANRLRAGQHIPIEISEVNLKILAQETLDNLKTVHGDRFVLHAQGSLLGQWCSQSLKRILENLCSNAVKYGCPDSPVTVSLEEQSGEVNLSVHNVGESLGDEEKEKIFDIFLRAPAAEASGKTGWGIGLTIVKGLTESHGGKVSVQSVDSGTAFVVTLPKDSRPFQPKGHP